MRINYCDSCLLSSVSEFITFIWPLPLRIKDFTISTCCVYSKCQNSIVSPSIYVPNTLSGGFGGACIIPGTFSKQVADIKLLKIICLEIWPFYVGKYHDQIK